MIKAFPFRQTLFVAVVIPCSFVSGEDIVDRNHLTLGKLGLSFITEANSPNMLRVEKDGYVNVYYKVLADTYLFSVSGANGTTERGVNAALARAWRNNTEVTIELRNFRGGPDVTIQFEPRQTARLIAGGGWRMPQPPRPSLRKVDSFPKDFLGQTFTFVCYLSTSPLFMENMMTSVNGWRVTLFSRSGQFLTNGGTFVGRDKLCVLLDEGMAKQLFDVTKNGQVDKFAVTFVVREEQTLERQLFYTGRVSRLVHLGEGGPNAEE